jgi:hypothetical protein
MESTIKVPDLDMAHALASFIPSRMYVLYDPKRKKVNEPIRSTNGPFYRSQAAARRANRQYGGSLQIFEFTAKGPYLEVE